MATYFGFMREYGKRKEREDSDGSEDSGEEEGEDDDSLPTVSGRKLNYPEELAAPRRKKKKKRGEDPYKHLGPIGYTRNTWMHAPKSSEFKSAQNLLLGFHVKKSAMLELARRMILAESLGGLPRDCDNDSLVSTEKFFYKKGKAPDRTHNMEIHEANRPIFDVSEYNIFKQ